MKKLARILAVLTIMMVSLLGALIPTKLIYADSTYNLSQSPFTWNGTNFSNGVGWSNGSAFNTYTISWDMTGDNNISCGLYSDGVTAGTVYYEYGDKASVDALMAVYSQLCQAYADNLFMPTMENYEYQGDPSGWAVIGGYTDPPTLTNTDPIRWFPDPYLDEVAHIATGVSNTSDMHQSDLDGVASFYSQDSYIEDLTGMEYWTSLTVLNLGWNRITDITPLASLTSLTNLNIGANFISNISCLVGVLDSGDILSVTTNPLNEQAYDTDIPALEADGVTVYYDEEPVPAPTIPPPPSGNRSVFTLPATEFLPEETYFWGMFTYATNIYNCSEWYEAWDEMPLMVYYLTIIENSDFGSDGEIARSLYGFNTSEIPDDAIITDAFLRIVPWRWDSESDWDVNDDGLVDEGDMDAIGLHWGETGAPGWIPEDANKDGVINVGDEVVVGQHWGLDYDFIVGGTHNTSIFPFVYDYHTLEYGTYRESEFYGNFGSFNTSDIPLAIGTENTNSSYYVDIPFNDDGVEYINPAGLTALSIRTQSDIDRVCPNESGSVELFLWAGQLGQYYYIPNIQLVVDWHEPSEIIITNDSISVMMTIQALIFALGGILGILALLMKPDVFSFGLRVGLLLGLTIMTVIGVAMLESIIVTVTR